MYKYIKYHSCPEDLFENEELKELPQGDYVLTFDQATTNTGIAIFNMDGNLRGYGVFIREDGEHPAKYKAEVKRFIVEFMRNYNVPIILHEEVYGKMYGATKMLHSMETLFIDIKYESFPSLTVIPKPNKWWKKRLLYPEKVTTLGTDHEKKQIKEKIKSIYIVINEQQDIYDAIGIGLGWFRVKKGELPAEFTVERKPINKRLAVEYELAWTDEEDFDLDCIKTKSMNDYVAKHGVAIYDYDTKLSLEDNLRLACSQTDAAVFTIIPDHRNFGGIILTNGLKNEPNKHLICFGKLKSAR